jgi:hypothetical protein
MRNRCTEAFGLCRSRLTVDAKVKCSSTAQLRFPDATRDPLTPHQSFPSSALTPCSTPPSTWTSAHDHPRKHLHQHCLTALTPHLLTFPLSHCPPLVPSKSRTHDSTAPMVPVAGTGCCGATRGVWSGEAPTAISVPLRTEQHFFPRRPSRRDSTSPLVQELLSKGRSEA